jgi:hypothetical protein
MATLVVINKVPVRWIPFANNAAELEVLHKNIWPPQHFFQILDYLYISFRGVLKFRQNRNPRFRVLASILRACGSLLLLFTK